MPLPILVNRYGKCYTTSAEIGEGHGQGGNAKRIEEGGEGR